MAYKKMKPGDKNTTSAKMTKPGDKNTTSAKMLKAPKKK